MEFEKRETEIKQKEVKVKEIIKESKQIKKKMADREEEFVKAKETAEACVNLKKQFAEIGFDPDDEETFDLTKMKIERRKEVITKAS